MTKRKAPADQKKRGKIILFADQGLNNTEIANNMETSRKTVRKWRHRWAIFLFSNDIDEIGESMGDRWTKLFHKIIT